MKERSGPSLSPLGPRLTRADFLRLLLGSGAALLCGGARAGEPGVEMRARPIPSSGEAIPVVGLGTWRTFDVGASPEERAPLMEVLRLLLAAGGKVIDSSPMYGRSEAVIGELLAEMGARDQAFIATKVWTRGRRRGVEQMRESMAKLKSPRIDLMQIHNLVDWQTHLSTLREWKEAGRLRYIGITHYTRAALDDLAWVIEREPLDFVQCSYSLGVLAAERRLLPLAAERGVAVLVNRPFGKGALFRFARGRALPPWAADFACASWAQFFLKFILSHPAVTCVIPGTSKPDHLLDNVEAGRGRLPDASERRRMVEFWESL